MAKTTIPAGYIAANAITATEIAANAITAAAIATDAISADIADNAITSAKIAKNAVGSSEIAGNSVGISELNVSDGTNGQYLQTNGSGTLSFSTVSGYTDSDVESYLNTSAIYTDATNDRLGIGTSSPGTLVDIVGTGTDLLRLTAPTQPVIRISRTSGAELDVSTNSAQALIRTNTSHPIDFLTNSIQAMRIDTSQNVGIGTTSPDARLEVAGTSFAFNSTNNRPAIIISGSYGGALGFEDTKEAGFYAQDSGDTFNLYVGRTIGTDTPASKIVQTWKSSGKVGIGTDSPNQELHVVTSSGNADLRVQGGDGNGAVDSSTYMDIYHSAAESGIYSNGTQGLRFGTNGDTVRAILTSAGNFGINWGAPTARLGIIQSGSSTPGMNITDGSSSDFHVLAGYTSGLCMIGPSAGSLAIKTANSERMRIDTSGKVGINLTSPSYNLHVAGTGSAEGTLGVQSVGNSQFRLVADNSALVAIQGGTGTATSQVPIYFSGMNGSNFTMVVQTSTQRVGIGTTSPSYPLDVVGQNTSYHMVRFVNTADGGGGNGTTFQVYNNYGNHSWGVVQECRVGNGGGSDNPSILFSSETESTNTWSVGYGYTDNSFRIKTDHGVRNGGWGTARLTLDRSGNCTITGSLTQNSDERLKENIQTIENAIDTIKQLRGVTFDWIESGVESMGLIAQEVEIVPIANRLVRESIDDGNMEEFKPKTVNYQNMVALLIEGIKELKEENDALKARLDAGGL